MDLLFAHGDDGSPMLDRQADPSERIEQIQLYDEPYEASELAHMWICNNDARNYAVIRRPRHVR